ncbi:MAG TPA: FRG domain-containing protein [Anaerolineales bacterium]|nr:FRG domain-containing protein [Anaerolineales bacterium]
MKEVAIKSFAELHEMIENYDARTVIYRGVRSVQYPLIPKIGRIVPPDSARSKEWNEKEILRLFKEQSLPYLDFMPTNDWDWLALGQQYGLPTRLLDWTGNPLVACYFAVEQEANDDSVIYAYRNKSYIDVEEHQDPFKYRQVGKFIPRHLTRRITTQGGLFTIHPDPYEPFKDDDMEKIVIPNGIRATLKKTLNKYGVDRFSLFPGLDSLAAHIEWLQSKGY